MALENEVIEDREIIDNIESTLNRWIQEYKSKQEQPRNHTLIFLLDMYTTYKEIKAGRKQKLTKMILNIHKDALEDFRYARQFYHMRTEYPSVLPALQDAHDNNWQYYQNMLQIRREQRQQKLRRIT